MGWHFCHPIFRGKEETKIGGIYCKIFGLGVTENGEKTYAYLKIESGDKSLPQTEMEKSFRRAGIADLVHAFPRDVVFLSREEYERECGTENEN